MIQKVNYRLPSCSGYSYPGYPGMVPEENDKISFTGRAYPKVTYPMSQPKTSRKLDVIA